MTATRREAIELLEQVPEDKLVYVVQILRAVNGLIGVPEKQHTKKIDLDQFVMSTTERGRNVDEYMKEMRDNAMDALQISAAVESQGDVFYK